MTDHGDSTTLGRLAALAAALALALLVLVAVGPEIPGPPTPISVSSWTDWELSVGPAGVVMALVRGLALVACAYLLVVVSVELVGRRCGRPGLVRTGRRLWVPGVRAVLGPVAGAGLLVAVVAAPPVAPAAGAVAGPPTAVVMHQVADPPSTPATSALDAPPVMVVIGPGAPSTPEPGPPATVAPSDPPSSSPVTPTSSAPPAHPAPVATVGTAPPAPGPATADPTPAQAVPPATSWTIRPGDHLWRVAATTLAEQWHAAPTDAQVLGYLDVLVAANRDRLVVPGNADLVYPGQVFALPAVPVAPT